MSNNVLWAGYRTDCYVGVVSGEITSFDISTSNNYGCYFGKLNPNTTYTIKRLDTSSRMRIGVANTDYSTTYTMVDPANYTHTQIIDSNDSHTFTTNANTQYIVVYYTNTGETNIRIMLNEGTSILPYEPPTEPPYSWIITDGINNNYPMVDNGPLPVEASLTEPYPKWAWIIDPSLSDGYPHIEGLATAYIMPDNQFLDSWGLAVLWGRILELLANKADIAYADAGIAGMMLLHEQLLLLLMGKADITYVDAEIDLLSNKTALVNSSTEIETNQLWLDGKTIWRKVFEVPDAELDEVLATQIPMGLEEIGRASCRERV